MSEYDEAEQPDEDKAAMNGDPRGGSIADVAAADEGVESMPVPTVLTGDGQIPLPGLGRRGGTKPPVEVLVKIGASATPGAGQLNPEAEYLLVTRVQYQKTETVKMADAEGRVKGWKVVQHVRPTWTESLDAFLEANGLKIVAVDEAGDSIDPGNLVNVEDFRKVREDALAG